MILEEGALLAFANFKCKEDAPFRVQEDEVLLSEGP